MPKPLELNPDGYSVKNAKMIYAPTGQAGEYSRLAANPYRGCGNKCVYCYVPSVIRMERADFDAGAVPRANYLRELQKDAMKYQHFGSREQVMFSFTTDPYHPGDTSLTRDCLKVVADHGLGFCTLTKGGRRALRDLDLFKPERDAFASTLTSLDPDVSLRWESEAALPADRIATLKEFHDANIYTWVSLEPVFDVEATLEIIRRTHEFVDLFKIGRINYSPMTKRINWQDFAARVLELLADSAIKSDHYIKEDLQPFLPAGYRNVKYRPQLRRQLPVLN